MEDKLRHLNDKVNSTSIDKFKIEVVNNPRTKRLELGLKNPEAVKDIGHLLTATKPLQTGDDKPITNELTDMLSVLLFIVKKNTEDIEELKNKLNKVSSNVSTCENQLEHVVVTFGKKENEQISNIPVVEQTQQNETMISEFVPKSNPDMSMNRPLRELFKPKIEVISNNELFNEMSAVKHLCHDMLDAIAEIKKKMKTSAMFEWESVSQCGK